MPASFLQGFGETEGDQPERTGVGAQFAGHAFFRVEEKLPFRPVHVQRPGEAHRRAGPAMHAVIHAHPNFPAEEKYPYAFAPKIRQALFESRFLAFELQEKPTLLAGRDLGPAYVYLDIV